MGGCIAVAFDISFKNVQQFARKNLMQKCSPSWCYNVIYWVENFSYFHAGNFSFKHPNIYRNRKRNMQKSLMHFETCRKIYANDNSWNIEKLLHFFPCFLSLARHIIRLCEARSSKMCMQRMIKMSSFRITNKR